MSITTIIRGRAERKPRILVYGEQKIGKTTFPSKAANPVYLGPEDGAPHLDVARFPSPGNWPNFISQVDWLIKNDHDHQTVVVDTLDALEPLLWRHLCDLHNKRSIEDFGYGKGYELALDSWRPFIALLETLNKKMTVVLLAHQMNRTVPNVEGDDYERTELKLHKKASALFLEWVDVIGFACRQVRVKDKECKVKSVGERELRTGNTPALVTGSRWAIPESLPLEWGDFKQALANAGAFGAPKKEQAA